MRTVLFLVLACFVASSHALPFSFKQRMTKQAEPQTFHISLLETKLEALAGTLYPDGANNIPNPEFLAFPPIPPKDHTVPKPPECGNPEYAQMQTFTAPESLKTVRSLATLEWHSISNVDEKKYACGLRGYYLRQLLPLAVQYARLENPTKTFGPLDMFFSGTPSIDSDIDVSINGQGSEYICGSFNKLFSEIWPTTQVKRTSATVFDLNVYCTNAIADKAAIEAPGYDTATGGYAKIVPDRNLYSLEKCVNSAADVAVIDQVEQHTFALSKLYLYLEKEDIQAMFTVPDPGKKFVTEQGKVNELLTRGEAIFNKEVIQTYQELKVERSRLSGYDPNFAHIQNDELVSMRNGINHRDLILCARNKEKIYPSFNAELVNALTTEEQKNRYKASECQFTKKCYALANVHALETYWCYGTLLDVLIVQQLNAMPDSALSVHHRIDSLLENYADVSKEFEHILHPPPTKLVPKPVAAPVQMIYLFKKIAKYFYRFLFAYKNYLVANGKTVDDSLNKALPAMQNIYKFHKFLKNAKLINVAAKTACYHISVLLGKASVRTDLDCEAVPAENVGTLLTTTAAKKPSDVTNEEKGANIVAGEVKVDKEISVEKLREFHRYLNAYAGNILATIIGTTYKTIDIPRA